MVVLEICKGWTSIDGRTCSLPTAGSLGLLTYNPESVPKLDAAVPSKSKCSQAFEAEMGSLINILGWESRRKHFKAPVVKIDQLEPLETTICAKRRSYCCLNLMIMLILESVSMQITNDL